MWTGFRQSEKQRSGFEDGYINHVVQFQKDDTLVYAPRTWTDDVIAFANMLRRQGVEHIAMLSYSHGQAAATKFAEYAHSIGMSIELWLVCDGVSRPSWLPRAVWAQPFAIRAVFRDAKIKVPRNIKRTVYVKQQKDFPFGHELVPEGDNIVELYGTYTSVGHCEIDESDHWWGLVIKELRSWTNPPKAIPIPE